MRYLLRYFLVYSVLMGAQEATASESGCEALGVIAESIMKGRQLGLSLQESMDVVKNDDSPAATIYSRVVMAAYDLPRMRSEVARGRAIAEFRDSQQLACMKVMNQP